MIEYTIPEAEGGKSTRKSMFMIPLEGHRMRTVSRRSWARDKIKMTRVRGQVIVTCPHDDYNLKFTIPEDFDFLKEGRINRIQCVATKVRRSSAGKAAESSSESNSPLRIQDDDDSTEIEYFRYWTDHDDNSDDEREYPRVVYTSDTYLTEVMTAEEYRLRLMYPMKQSSSSVDTSINSSSTADTSINSSSTAVAGAYSYQNKFHTCPCSNPDCMEIRLRHNYGWEVGVWGECQYGDKHIAKKAKK